MNSSVTLVNILWDPKVLVSLIIFYHIYISHKCFKICFLLGNFVLSVVYFNNKKCFWKHCYSRLCWYAFAFIYTKCISHTYFPRMHFLWIELLGFTICLPSGLLPSASLGCNRTIPINIHTEQWYWKDFCIDMLYINSPTEEKIPETNFS